MLESSLMSVAEMNSNHQVEENNGRTPEVPRFSGNLDGNLLDLGPYGCDGDNSLAPLHTIWSPEATGENLVLSETESKAQEQSGSHLRYLPKCRREHNQNAQCERPELPPQAVPFKEVSQTTGFDTPQQSWKVPFMGQDPVTGKVYFIDTSPYATNLNTTVLCKRHLWHQCPFNDYHLIKTAKKFVTHTRRCIHQSAQGYNGKQSQREVKNWIECQFNSNHRVHKNYLIQHYLNNCSDLKRELTLAWKTQETAV